MSHSETRSDWAERMQEVADATAPAPASVARVQSRLAVELAPTTALLQRIPSPDAAAAARVQARLAAAPRGAGAPRWVPALAALAVVTGAGALWLAPAVPEVGTSEQGVTVDGVERLRFDGEGAPRIEAGRAAVDWVVGRLDVLPGADLPVDVTTREATVAVGSGGLVLVRDALGTHLEAVGEPLSVRCGDAAVRDLVVGEGLTCLPTTSTGLLGRARALADQGDTAGALDAVAAGLDMGPDAPVAVELHTVGMDAALAGRDMVRAVAFAEEALALGPTPRADELHRVAARGWLIEGDCGRALPHLDALQGLDDAERRHMDHCRASEEAR